MTNAGTHRVWTDQPDPVSECVMSMLLAETRA
jgi:hypothetical protein